MRPVKSASDVGACHIRPLPDESPKRAIEARMPERTQPPPSGNQTSLFLISVSSPQSGEVFTRTCSGAVLIGRAEGSDIHLAHPLVSRRHAEVEPISETEFTIRDLESRNATYVDGSALRGSSKTIGLEAVIQIGPYVLDLRRPSNDDDTLLVRPGDLSAHLKVDHDLRRILIDGHPADVRISQIEFQLLHQLESSFPRTLDSESLGNHLWGESQWDAYMLHNVISRLRRKLDGAGHDGAAMVVTVAGLGYRLG